MKTLSKLLILHLLTACLFAGPARPGTLDFVQEDGQTFSGTLKGDEWLHWVSLPNDYVAIFNPQSKNYEYAVITLINGKNYLKSSGVKVDEKLHKLQPEKLSQNIPIIDTASLSTLHKEAKGNYNKNALKRVNTPKYNKKALDTKSTQWKEILKEENPPK